MAYADAVEYTLDPLYGTDDPSIPDVSGGIVDEKNDAFRTVVRFHESSTPGMEVTWMTCLSRKPWQKFVAITRLRFPGQIYYQSAQATFAEGFLRRYTVFSTVLVCQPGCRVTPCSIVSIVERGTYEQMNLWARERGSFRN